MELVREIDFRKRDWRRTVYLFAVMLGVAFVAVDLWSREFLAAGLWHLLVAAVIIFPLHELVHGAFFKVWTGKVKFGAGFTKLGPALYATSPGSVLSRNKMLVLTLAPQVLTVLCLSLGGLPLPEPARIILVASGVFNLGGGVGDFYCIAQMLRYSKDLQLEDSTAGLRFYMPVKEGMSESAKPTS